MRLFWPPLCPCLLLIFILEILSQPAHHHLTQVAKHKTQGPSAPTRFQARPPTDSLHSTEGPVRLPKKEKERSCVHSQKLPGRPRGGAHA